MTTQRSRRLSLVLAILLGVFGLLPFALKPAPSQATACSAQYGFLITSPPGGSLIHGGVLLVAQTAMQGTSISFQVIPANAATPVLTLPASPLDPLHWQANWPSAGVPDGSYQIIAQGYFPPLTGTTATICQTDPLAVSIQNTTTAPTNTVQSLVLTPNPVTWTGPTNFRFPVSVTVRAYTASGASTDVTSAATVQWATTLGTLDGTGAGPATSLFSGPTAGTGVLTAKAAFQGTTSSVAIPLTVTAVTGVVPSTAPTPSTGTGSGSTTPSPTGSGTGSNQTPASTTTQPTVAPAPASWVDTAATDCMKARLGNSTWELIKTAKRGLSVEERRLVADCFASNKSIPATFAPVDPGKVKELPVAPPAQLGTVQIKNTRVTASDKTTKEVLELSGKASPDEEVYIWIYSEPMVLKAKADGKGDWKYTLENPLAPGKHEIYVTKQASDKTFVRSQPAFISVAKAASSEQNPQGNSLVLLQDGNRLLWVFLAVGLLLILAAIGIIVRVRHLRLFAPAEKVAEVDAGPATTLPSTSASPAQAPAPMPATAPPAPSAPETATPAEPPTTEPPAPTV